MSNENSQKITYKMIIIGDSAVGKTCIFKKITSGTFTEKSISTIGMDRRTLSFTIKNEEGNDVEIDVQLWDTAGQERFRSITTSYYKSSQGLLLMYDITRKETFDNLENWILSIKDSLGEEEKYLIVLVGNKVDLANSNPESREVTTEDAENLCKEKNIYWGGECSAKDFTENELNDIFTKYTQEIYKKVGVNIVKAQKVDKNNDKQPKKFKC
jgi:Ras-related protein Rab-1A